MGACAKTEFGGARGLAQAGQKMDVPISHEYLHGGERVDVAYMRSS